MLEITLAKSFCWKKNSDDSEKNVVSLCMAKRHQFLVCYYCKDVDLLLIIRSYHINKYDIFFRQ